MTTKEFLRSPGFKKALYALSALVVVLVVFQAGMFVGYRKAARAFSFGNYYYRAFGERRGEMPFEPSMGLSNAHGSVGRIVSIALPRIIIEDRDGTEKALLVASDTEVHRFRENVGLSTLHVNDYVVVIGSPNEKGEIEAKLIRLMPPPPVPVSTSSSVAQ